MRWQPEHRKALTESRTAAPTAPRAPDDHRLAVLREHERSRAERERLRSLLSLHRDVLEQVRDQLARDRNYHRRAYEQNRWWIELALKWWEARRAA
ncbi:MAG: hypothetical protein QN116_11920 [Armatimonadota bacterium]|nr:hypothetical protein [Armatimonadota bacterium]